MKNLDPTSRIKNSVQLELPITEDNYLLSSYVNALLENSCIRQLVGSEAFARLWEISFLGAIDYLPEYKNISRRHKTRAAHSLNVAALALLIAQTRGYSKNLTKHLVVAGLLHDIGHPPLSHSVEPYLQKEFGYGHHEMGEMLLDGEVALGKPLTRLLLQNKINISFIKQLIAGKAKNTDGGDLFSSKINLDTIEGIIRSRHYLNNSSYLISPIRVALASFTNVLDNKLAILDEFWRLKDQVYKNLIISGNGLLADLNSQRLFLEQEITLTPDYLFKSEKSWQQKYSGIFKVIKSVAQKQDKYRGIETFFVFTKRNYYINTFEPVPSKRYLYTKHQVNYEIS